MLRTACAATLILAMLLSGCSGKRTLDADELKSATAEIISIASEGELLAEVVAEHHAPAKYSEGHPEYLRDQAQAVARELEQGQPEGDAKRNIGPLRDTVKRLLKALDALPASGDSGWQQSHSQLDDIRNTAQEIRRTF
jgi:hypothetical protein